MDNNVNPAKAPADSIGNGLAAVGAGDVGRNKHLIARKLAARSRPGQDFDTGSDKGAKAAAELEIFTHRRISSETIRPPSISKIFSSLIGLPGKLPETLPVTTTFPSRVDTLSGSTV